jgi:hypothetical protein
MARKGSANRKPIILLVAVVVIGVGGVATYLRGASARDGGSHHHVHAHGSALVASIDSPPADAPLAYAERHEGPVEAAPSDDLVYRSKFLAEERRYRKLRASYRSQTVFVGKLKASLFHARDVLAATRQKVASQGCGAE